MQVTLSTLKSRFTTRAMPSSQDWVDLLDSLYAVAANSVGALALQDRSIVPLKMALGDPNTFLRTNEAGDDVVWALSALRYMSASFAAVDADDLGSQNKFHITVDPAPTAYAFGQLYVVKAAKSNTGPCTLRVGDLADVPWKKNGTEDLAGGDVVSGVCYLVCHDGTNVQMMGGLSSGGGGGSSVVVNARPIFIAPVEVASGTAAVASATALDLSAYIPEGALAAILFCRSAVTTAGGVNVTYAIEARKDGAASMVPLLAGALYDTGDATTEGEETNAQVQAPLAADRTLEYTVAKTGSTSAFNWSITVVGYMEGTSQVANAAYEETAAQPLPTGGSALTFAHGLGRLPKVVRGVLVCKIAEHGYVVGEEIELFSVSDSGDVAAVTVTSTDEEIRAIVRAGALTVDGDVLTRNAAPANNWDVKFYLTDILSAVVTNQGNAFRQAVSPLISVPSSYVTAQEITFDHLLGVVPTYFKWVLVCQTAELDFLVGEEVEFACNATARPEQMASVSATRMRLLLDSVPCLVDTTKTLTAITPANWKIKGYAYDSLAGNYGVAIKKAESSLLAIPAANNTDVVTFAHGLGVTPDMVEVFLEAVSSNNGYAVGDRVPLAACFVPSGVDYIGVTPAWDATNVTIKGSWLSYVLQLAPRTGSHAAPFAVLTASWNFRILAYSHHRNPAGQRYVTPSIDQVALTSGANEVSEAHGLDGIPDTMQWVLVCQTNDGEFVAGEEISVESFLADTGNDYAGAPAFKTFKTATEVGIRYHGGASSNRIRYISQVTENLTVQLTLANWKLKCYATKFI